LSRQPPQIHSDTANQDSRTRPIILHDLHRRHIRHRREDVVHLLHHYPIDPARVQIDGDGPDLDPLVVTRRHDCQTPTSLHGLSRAGKDSQSGDGRRMCAGNQQRSPFDLAVDGVDARERERVVVAASDE
ncbi:hypothetical protein LTR04_002565, partial [Oleoguttula sp. CCFEE 6159]